MKDIMKAERIHESMAALVGEKDAKLAIEAVRTGKAAVETMQAKEEVWL